MSIPSSSASVATTPSSSPDDQPRLELAPLLRPCSPRGRARSAPPARDARALELEHREARHQLDRLARLHEHDRPRALDARARRAGRAASASAEPRAPSSPRRSAAGSTSRSCASSPASRRARSPRTSSSPVSRVASSPGLATVADASRKRGAVPCSSQIAPQPPQHVGHVRAEDAAVDVRLVDHHDREVAEEVRPGRMVGEDPEVQHVRVGQHDVGAPAQLGALLARRVAVVDRRPRALQPERVQRARLVLRERLGRIQEQRPARARRARASRASAAGSTATCPTRCPS